jgi:TM2 domain-containing membrane protein YozV
MESQLYMRVRGRVLGPYDPDKLQGLARRGQLSRMHELSADGVSWVRASNYPELFTGGQAELPPIPSDGASAMPPDTFAGGYPLGPPPTPGPSAAAGTKWYYTSGGEQRGPVDFANLQILAGLGQLGPQDQVWAEGMASWEPAAQISGLIKNTSPQETGQYCFACGSKIDVRAEICPKCGVRQTPHSRSISAGPNRVAACLLALFLGTLGAHKFYLGRTAVGVVYLLCGTIGWFLIFPPLILSVICLVEGLTYLSYSDEEFARKYAHK